MCVTYGAASAARTNASAVHNRPLGKVSVCTCALLMGQPLQRVQTRLRCTTGRWLRYRYVPYTSHVAKNKNHSVQLFEHSSWGYPVVPCVSWIDALRYENSRFPNQADYIYAAQRRGPLAQGKNTENKHAVTAANRARRPGHTRTSLRRLNLSSLPKSRVDTV